MFVCDENSFNIYSVLIEPLHKMVLIKLFSIITLLTFSKICNDGISGVSSSFLKTFSYSNITVENQIEGILLETIAMKLKNQIQYENINSLNETDILKTYLN